MIFVEINSFLKHEVPSELNSVDSFAISKHQMCWSYCLGEVTKIIVELCPGVISYLKKYNHLRIEDIVKTGLWEQENFIHLWRNYLTLSSIVSSGMFLFRLFIIFFGFELIILMHI